MANFLTAQHGCRHRNERRDRQRRSQSNECNRARSAPPGFQQVDRQHAENQWQTDGKREQQPQYGPGYGLLD